MSASALPEGCENWFDYISSLGQRDGTESMPVFYALRSAGGDGGMLILGLALISAVIPFLGRTAIGWVVDVITVGSTIAYAYTSAAAFKYARSRGNKPIMATGIAGTIVSAIIALLLLVSDLIAGNSLSSESYLLLAFWSILGIVYFRFVFNRDRNRRFGSRVL